MFSGAGPLSYFDKILGNNHNVIRVMDIRKRIVVVGLVTVLQVEHFHIITLRYQDISVGVKQFALRITEYIIAVKLQQLCPATL